MASFKEKPLILIPWILVVLVVWIVFGVVTFLGGFGDWSESGVFGDTFGALNTLFTGLAFALLIYTASLQGRELELQRIEMRETREELQGQKEQLAKQNELTALSAQLSVLPTLISFEHGAIGRISDQWMRWTSSRPTLLEVTSRIDGLRAEAHDLQVRLPELKKRSNEHPHPNSPAHAGVQLALRNAQNEREEIDSVIPRLVLLKRYLTDIEAVYAELGQARAKAAENPTSRA